MFDIINAHASGGGAFLDWPYAGVEYLENPQGNYSSIEKYRFILDFYRRDSNRAIYS